MKSWLEPGAAWVGRSRWAAAVFAGLALALAFPKAGVAGLAWIAPGVLLLSAAGLQGKAAFRIGYAGGLVFYLASLYWLLFIPVAFLPVLGWLALSAYLALFTGGWVWLCRTLAPAPAQAGWGRRNGWALQCAAAWVASEMVIGRFLSGFPWDFLGVSQYRIIPLIQIAEYTGVYGVSFLVIWFSAALVNVAALMKGAGPGGLRHASWGREMALPLAALVTVAAAGVKKIRSFAPPSQTVQAALIQPSIPQTLIWDEGKNAERFRQLIELSERALADRPDLLIWPEAALPNMLRHDRATADEVVRLAAEHRAWIILGSDDAELRFESGERQIDYFNSAFAVSPEGELRGMYRKRRLVIFGEYIPFTKQIPLLRKLLPAGESGFTPGDGPVSFALDPPGINVSVLICFEDTFPHLARQHVTPQTDFLINLTNNGWFGESAAQWQHAATAVFRAVENRLPLVRCANNGLTCWVDELGVMHEVYFPGSRDIYQAGHKQAAVPVLPPGSRRELTFYTRHGDVFGWSCCLAAAGALGRAWAVRRRALKEGTI